MSVLLNESNFTGQVYTIDQTAPSVTLAAPTNGSSLNSNEPTFSGSAGTAAIDLPTITIKIYSGGSATGTPVQTLTATSSGTYSGGTHDAARLQRHLHGTGVAKR